MIEEIYEYLINYGFKDEELKKFQRENEDLYFVGFEIVKSNLDFLENKEIEKTDIMNVIRENPYMLTCGSKKRNMLEEIYNSLYTKEEIKELIKKYPQAYTVNPLELKDVIDYIQSKNINFKEFIKKNVKIVSFDKEEIKKFIEK